MLGSAVLFAVELVVSLHDPYAIYERLEGLT